MRMLEDFHSTSVHGSPSTEIDGLHARWYDCPSNVCLLPRFVPVMVMRLSVNEFDLIAEIIVGAPMMLTNDAT